MHFKTPHVLTLLIVTLFSTLTLATPALSPSPTLHLTPAKYSYEFDPPEHEPTPPPCTVNIQICMSLIPPFYTPPHIRDRPDNLAGQNCSISFVNEAGLWVYPLVEERSGKPGEGAVPCNPGVAEIFKMPDVGVLEVVFNKTSGPLPDDPQIMWVIACFSLVCMIGEAEWVLMSDAT